MSDRIIVRDLQVFARHGVLAEEARLGQRFALDIVAFLDLGPAGRSDELAASVSYVEIVETAVEVLTTRRFKLLEAASQAVADALFERFATIEHIAIELRKPGAPIDAVFAHVAVAIERSRDGR